jgi:hypothetical protein
VVGDVVITLKPEAVVTTKGEPVATVGLCVVVCAPDSTCCAQAPDTGSATVPSIKANTPRCDTRTKLRLWGNFCAAFAIVLVILAPTFSANTRQKKGDKAGQNMRQ